MICKDDIVINIDMKDANKMVVRCTPFSEEYLYAFQLFCNDKMVDRVLYSEQNETIFWLSQTGEYTVRACIKHNERSVANLSKTIIFENPVAQFPIVEEEKVSLIKKVKFVSGEIANNFVMLCRIARYDYKLMNKDSYLGKMWSILTPLIQIGTYWLVFGIGIRSGRSMDGHPFLVWMLCGLIPWFFMNYGITKAASSIYSKAGIITQMKYPVATVPIGVIVTGWMEHVIELLILFATLLAYGYFPTLCYLNLIYYIVYNFIFLCSLSLITSVLVMLARDFEKVIASITRLLFYVTPILWSMDKMPDLYQKILGFNPVLYVITGFRDSILYHVNFWEHPKDIVFFWMLNLILFVLGCDLQYKYRKKFVDLV